MGSQDQHASPHRVSTFQGSLIVLGTSVGGGMLGLPVITASSGYIPSLVLLAISWFFMTFTGLILAELSCRKKQNVNLLSLYASAFPRWGAVFSVVIYLILFYALMVAYTLALGRMLGEVVGIGSWHMPVVVSFGGVCFLFGLRSLLTKMNGFLVLLMAVSYALFCYHAVGFIQIERLCESDWWLASTALPLIFTSFGFQGTVPSLAGLMGYEKSKIFRAIIIGTTSTAFVYVLWQTVILGALPMAGHMGLAYAREHGLDAITPLAFHLPERFGASFLIFGKIFAFSAVATSLIGVSLGMQDFLADLFGLHHKTKKSRLLLAFAVYIPSLFFSLLFPGAFLMALSIAGGIGCAFLLGAMPSLTALKDGGLIALRPLRWLLVVTTLFFFFEIAEEIALLLFS